MKIAVIGANGRTGRAFVAAAIAAGHHVVAGVHRQSLLPEHANITVLPCDATQPQEVESLIRGVDAVVMLIGHVRGSVATVQTDATRVVIAEMKVAGIRRLVSLTGTGVRRPGDIVPWFDRLLNAFVVRIDPARVHDGITHAHEIEQSDLAWTILRVLKLERYRLRSVELSPHGPACLWVSREQVAHCLLEVLEDNTFLKALPVLSSHYR